MADPKPASGVPALVVALLALAYTACYSALSLYKYRWYLYNDFDFAIFAQAVDGILHGSLHSSIRGMNWLGDHSSFVLFLIAPIYAVFRHPATLLVLQSVALGAGAWPVFAIARRALRNDWAAVCFAAAYVLYPAVGYSNLFEFHPETFATTGLLFTFLYALEARLVPTLLWAVFSLSCREDVAFVVIGLGLYVAWIHRPRGERMALWLAGLGVLSLVVTFAILRPLLNHGEAGYADMYRAWGETIPQIARAMAQHPWRVVEYLVGTPDNAVDSSIKHQYAFFMLAPLAFLPLLSPLTLVLALPVVLLHFLSWRQQQHQIVCQYTALVTPVVFTAAILGLRNLAHFLRPGPRRAPERATRGKASRPAPARAPAPTPGTSSTTVALAAAGIVLAATIAVDYFVGPVFGVGQTLATAPPQSSKPTPYDRTMRHYRDAFLARVPREGGVVAGFDFLSHLASHRELHSAHHIYTGEFTFSKRQYPTPEGITGYIADLGSLKLVTYVEPRTGVRMRRLMDRNHLAPVDAAGDLVLMEREPKSPLALMELDGPEASHPMHVVFDEILAFTGMDSVPAQARAGDLVPIRTHWVHTGENTRLYLMGLALVGAGGQVVMRHTRFAGYGYAPIDSWPLNHHVTELYRLPLPPDLAPGTYTLGFTLMWAAEDQYGVAQPDDPAVRDAGGFITLGRITVR